MESWQRPRVMAFVGALVLVVLGAGTGSLVRHRMGFPLNPLEILGRDSTAEGRRELRALRRDPLVDFRAPGTRLRSTSEKPAGKDWWNADQPTEIRQRFSVQGEPGDAVDAYRRRAEAGGWQLVETACSFHFRSTTVVLTRPVAGRPVTLRAYGFLERPPRDRGLVVTLTVEPPEGPPQGPEGASLRRRDVHCLRSFDPADPTLLPPARIPGSSAELCGLLALADARRVVATATSVEPRGGDGRACYYGDVGRGGFSVVPADMPRAYYEDRRSAQDQGDDRYLLVDGGTSPGPRAAWVDTRLGPVEIYGGGTLDARQLAALAVVLARR